MESLKKQLIILFLFAVALASHAQVSFSYTAGYGTYDMGDMKRLLDASLQQVQGSLPPGVRITDRFPGYLTHNVDLVYRVSRHEFGLKGTYLTTGGKIAYSDYSGEYYEKLTLNGYRLGGLYRFHFAQSKLGSLPLSFYAELSPAITFTDVKYKGLLSLPDYNVHEENPEDNVSTGETGFSLQPLIGARLFVLRHVFVTANAGYDFEFGAKLSTTNNTLRADWSGFRLNGGVGYRF